MVKTTLDYNITDISAQEQDGALVALTRHVLVEDLLDATYQTLMSALDSIELEAGSIPDDHKDLVLRGRNPLVISTQQCTVELVYEHFNNDGQNLSVGSDGNSLAAHGVSFIRSRNSLQQITTQIDTETQDALSVSYTYVTVDTELPSGDTLKVDKELKGQTITQGGEISAFEPQETVSVSGIIDTSTPFLIAQDMIGSVNSTDWLGRLDGDWLCTSADWEHFSFSDAAGITPDRVKFVFEFQSKNGGWDPAIVFKDTRTGEPPPDLIDGIGFKTVQHYPRFDFRTHLNLLG